MNKLSHIKESKPVVFGCSGLSLSDEEKEFFKNLKPLGFILFSRNIKNRNQLENLIQELFDIVGWECPILIDQEGGRVQRLNKSNGFTDYPAMAEYKKIDDKEGIEVAKKKLNRNISLMVQDLKDLRIIVCCIPVLDLLFEDASEIISDRSFGPDPEVVSILGKVVCDAVMDAGCKSIMKHIPGHGRAKVDSHKSLPVVDASLDELRAKDFVPFKNLATVSDGAMVAHIIYTSIDSENISTFSKKVINLIREEIGFEGVLFSDDMCMHALKGVSFKDRAERFLSAGGDIVLHCSGDLEEMKEVAKGLGGVSKAETVSRLEIFFLDR